VQTGIPLPRVGTRKKTIRLLSRSGDYEKNTAQYKGINNISSLFTIFYIVDNLIQTFKQCATKPEIFQLSWHQDKQGKGRIDFVVAFVEQKTLSRILFHSLGMIFMRRICLLW